MSELGMTQTLLASQLLEAVRKDTDAGIIPFEVTDGIAKIHEGATSDWIRRTADTIATLTEQAFDDTPTHGFLIVWHGVKEWEWVDGDINQAREMATGDGRHLNYGRTGYSLVPCPIEPGVREVTKDNSVLFDIIEDIERRFFRTVNDSGANPMVMMTHNVLRAKADLPPLRQKDLPSWDEKLRRYCLPTGSRLLTNKHHEQAQ